MPRSGWAGRNRAILFALKRKRLRAAVSFYGKLPEPLDSIKNMYCPLLYHAAETDDTVTAEGLAQLTENRTGIGKNVEIRQYPGTSNGFCDQSAA